MAVPNTFTNGTVADANKVNENFDYVAPEIQAKAGEALTAGQLVYIKESDGKVYVADKDVGCVDGIVLANTNANATAIIQVGGKYTTTGLTANTVYYLGDSGALTTTFNSFQIGVAISTTILQINIIRQSLINNFSTISSIDTTGSTNNTITGTAANIYDFDTTTFYQNSSSWTGGISGSKAYIIIDYGKFIYNSTVFTKYYLTSSGGGSGQYYLSYSLNGSTWVELTFTADSDGREDTFHIPKFRYLRYVAIRTSSSGANSSTARVYWTHIIGQTETLVK